MARKRVNPIHWYNAIPHHRYLGVLGITFGLLWILLGLFPYDRKTWLLENTPVIFLVALLAIYYRRLRLSRMSYTLIFLFLCFHEIGAHYTYGRVPYDDLFMRMFGPGFNDLVGWERNNFDRVVHFLYGLLLAYPVREVFLRIANARGFWGYFLPLDLTMSTSMLYELLEWVTSIVFGDGSMDFIGTQGDIWDAHKDMALASLGALLAMTLTLVINWHFQRDFAREWNKSLEVKHPKPLGEEAAVRMMAEHSK